MLWSKHIHLWVVCLCRVSSERVNWRCSQNWRQKTHCWTREHVFLFLVAGKIVACKTKDSKNCRKGCWQRGCTFVRKLVFSLSFACLLQLATLRIWRSRIRAVRVDKSPNSNAQPDADKFPRFGEWRKNEILLNKKNFSSYSWKQTRRTGTAVLFTLKAIFLSMGKNALKETPALTIVVAWCSKHIYPILGSCPRFVCYDCMYYQVRWF